MRGLFLAVLFSGAMGVALADPIDEKVAAVMAQRKIPGLSLAIIEGGKIVKARGYGVTVAGGNQPVTTDTLFQAGSISKPVSALGALHLVEAGKLTLDGDVNTLLRTWRVPENEFTREQKVTVRRVLTHSAGLTVHGFPGYPITAPKPSLVQVLDGVKPANTRAIRVDLVPGTEARYSGGGYTVLQQLMIDVTGQPFPEIVRTTVLAPLGMEASTFEQPLPPERAALAATGHFSSGRPVRGNWHVYPEMAAAGLWTTASDLARYAIGVQEMYDGRRASPIISPALTKQMLTRQVLSSGKEIGGLGPMLAGNGAALRFAHGGRDEGFDAYVVAYASTGQGAAIMINRNDDTGGVDEILRAIGAEYHWARFPRPALLGHGPEAFVARLFDGDYEVLAIVFTAVVGLTLGGAWCLRRARTRSPRSRETAG